MDDETTVFVARRIITMDPACPEATHVAVRAGRVLAVGDAGHVASACGAFGGTVRTDDRLSGLVLMPGLVEGHCHAAEGGIWTYPYVGFHDRSDPEGLFWPGLTGMEAVVERLVAAERDLADPDATLFAWGFDPIFFESRRMTLADLDRVSTTRPVLVMHSNGHLLNVNSVILRRAGVLEGRVNIAGILRDADGNPTGELAEMAAKHMALRVAGNGMYGLLEQKRTLCRFAAACRRAGVTTATDLYSDLSDLAVENYVHATAAPDFPVRIVPALNGQSLPVAEGIARIDHLRTRNNGRLRFGAVKLMTDGSIQGFSARLRWPGYVCARPNGIWNIAPEELAEVAHAYHAAGIQLHIHVNGDEASEVAIEALEQALRRTPRPDHRHTLQHCQMADAAQFRRMAALGLCVNLFSNHVYYWGEQHARHTMGPDRARRMDAAATALACGVPLAIHSDAPVTPIGPLFTAWCAVNRLTAGGHVLGPEERIPVAAALRAITLGAAYTLMMDDEIGSIEIGKRADFCVLEQDPREVMPERLKDVPVWGTVLGGVVQPA